MKALPRLFSSRALPWVLLVLSLALNAFFVGGQVYTRLTLDRVAEARAEQRAKVARRLHLTAAQRDALRRLRRDVRARRRELAAASRRHGTVIWKELAKPEPDPRTIDRELDAMAELRRDFQRRTIDVARTFLDALSPDQRRALFETRAGPRFLFGGGRPRRRPLPE